MCFFEITTASFRGVFLKRQTSRFPRMCYKWCSLVRIDQ